MHTAAPDDRVRPLQRTAICSFCIKLPSGAPLKGALPDGSRACAVLFVLTAARPGAYCRRGALFKWSGKGLDPQIRREKARHISTNDLSSGRDELAHGGESRSRSHIMGALRLFSIWRRHSSSLTWCGTVTPIVNWKAGCEARILVRKSAIRL